MVPAGVDAKFEGLLQAALGSLPKRADLHVFMLKLLYIFVHGGLHVMPGMYGSPFIPDPARVLAITGDDLGGVRYWAVDAAHCDHPTAVDPGDIAIRALYVPPRNPVIGALMDIVLARPDE